MENPILPAHLSMRERQVMEIVIRQSDVTGRDIQQALPEPPTYSAVRSILRILINKKLLQKKRVDGRDWYSLRIPAAQAKASALQNFVQNFFSNSIGEAACALLGQKDVKLTAKEAAQLKKLIAEAQK
ncbi:MAG: BlaI/MecI/CopY family transcriptional regulator [Chthoniobacterales bacterium]